MGEQARRLKANFSNNIKQPALRYFDNTSISLSATVQQAKLSYQNLEI